MKKLIFILSIFLSAGIFSFAQTAPDSAKLAAPVYKDTIPIYKGWVSDFENIYTKSQIKTLDSLITVFEKKTSYEIAIITVTDSLTNDSSFDSYILKIANAWGVGKKGKDNGMVIGISSEFGRIRIINGAGVVSHLSDDDTKIIIETIFIADFKEGNYYKGTKDGLLEIMKKLKS